MTDTALTVVDDDGELQRYEQDVRGKIIEELARFIESRNLSEYCLVNPIDRTLPHAVN